MKHLLILLIIPFLFSCATGKDVYVCKGKECHETTRPDTCKQHKLVKVYYRDKKNNYDTTGNIARQ